MTDFKKALEGRTIKSVLITDSEFQMTLGNGNDVFVEVPTTIMTPSLGVLLVNEDGEHELIEREQ